MKIYILKLLLKEIEYKPILVAYEAQIRSNLQTKHWYSGGQWSDTSGMTRRLVAFNFFQRDINTSFHFCYAQALIRDGVKKALFMGGAIYRNL